MTLKLLLIMQQILTVWSFYIHKEDQLFPLKLFNHLTNWFHILANYISCFVYFKKRTRNLNYWFPGQFSVYNVIYNFFSFVAINQTSFHQELFDHTGYWRLHFRGISESMQCTITTSIVREQRQFLYWSKMTRRKQYFTHAPWAGNRINSSKVLMSCMFEEVSNNPAGMNETKQWRFMR